MKNTRILPIFTVLLGAMIFITSCTKNEAIEIPSVTTDDVFSISVDAATCRGFIDITGEENFVSGGICWSKNNNPSISDSKSLVDVASEQFSCTMHDLQSETTYYVKAFAVTESDKIVYGNVLSFQTPKIPDFGMVTIQGGTFLMGGLVGNIAPRHSVTLSSFKMGSTEVTQKDWVAIMGNNPSTFKGDGLPVETVNIADIQSYIQKLNQISGKSYRLPTEAEWEFAAKGGLDTTTTWAGTNQLDSVGKYIWNAGNAASTTHQVASKTPNTLGLYDMCGNVWEWCSDWYGAYVNSTQTNPTGQTTGYLTVVRGGSWSHDMTFCNVQNRSSNYPTDRKSTTGFRLVLVP